MKKKINLKVKIIQSDLHNSFEILNHFIHLIEILWYLNSPKNVDFSDLVSQNVMVSFK